MTLRHATPLTWRAMGITDTLDSSAAAQGSMAVLQNLIPDPSTSGVWVCRPAASLIIDLNAPGSGPFSSGFSSGFQQTFFASPGVAGMISCISVQGDLCYGMVAGPGGFDYPFGINLLTGVAVTISGGKDTTKLPQTVGQTGAWSPPSIAHVGAKLIFTHPGFLGGGSNLFFGSMDITDPFNPTWTAGNLTGAVQFAFPPTFVSNFNGRAYYLVNPTTGQPAAIFSDVLVPGNVTNATQIITFDDTTRLTALAPLPLNNQLGGIIQAMMVFKGSAQTYQVTGDASSTTAPLARNALNVATGTDAPDSIAVTPKGIAFAAPDGMRVIDFNAQVTDPIGWDGFGKVLPFINSMTTSRMTAASTGVFYRITVQDGSLPGSPYVEYWFDIVRSKWSGPHTFPANCIDNYKNTFVMSARGIPGKLWFSDTRQNSSSTFVENGTQLQWIYTTSMLPDTDEMLEQFMIESTIDMAMQSNTPYPVAALGAAGNVISQAPIVLSAATPLWGSVIWGQFTWGGLQGVLFPRPVAWPTPVVFRRMALSINGPSNINVKLGAFRCRYQKTGYLQQSLVA